jgi:hypothetical protein
MPRSQNVVFEGNAIVDAEFAHPPGLTIVRVLATGLRDIGWSASDFENWRDCGWSLECVHGQTTLLVALAQIKRQQWMLQISPLQVPGLLGGLFGGKPSATYHDVFALARDIHNLLGQSKTFTQMRWQWDSYPDEESSTTEPAEPSGL